MPLNRRKQLKLTGFTPAQRATKLTRTTVSKKRAKVTPEERNARKTVRARSEGICEICANARATNFQHRLSKAHCGPWTASNGIAVCGQGNASGCHGRIHQNPQMAIQQGWTIRSTDRRDPGNVPVWLAGHGYCFLHDNGHITEATEEDIAS